MPKKATKDEPKEATREDMVNAIMAPMRDAFKGEGITPKYLAKKLKRELNAKETKAQIPKGGFTFIYSKPMKAWDIQQKARQDAHKLMGDYPAEKKDITSGGRPIINMSDIPDEVLRKLAGN